jgi:F0F1-type ATP synthase assembly protein I
MGGRMTRTPDDRGRSNQEHRSDEDRNQEQLHEGPPARRPAIPTPNWGLAFDLGLRLGLAIIIGLLLGLAVDNWLGTSPAFTLIGLVFGVAAAFYTIWDVANKSMNR